MKIPCEFCGQTISEAKQTCPHCGAARAGAENAACGIPTTIEELRAYCRRHDLPLADMRVFLGEDYRGAKAFGIYRDETTGNVVVYKNKADGTRAVRYEGPDEAFGVRELYLKIKERVARQKRHLPPKGQRGPGEVRGPAVPSAFIPVAACVIVLVVLLVGLWATRAFPSGPSQGYYAYQERFYYYDCSCWYEWDIYDEAWAPAQADAQLVENPDDYYRSKTWRGSYNAGDFADSPWYSEETWEDDGQDYDWDDGDVWDDSYDDWDSDW